MNQEQIRLISWLYHFSTNEMKARFDEHSESDVRLLGEAIERRFPEYCDQIVNKKPWEGLSL